MKKPLFDLWIERGSDLVLILWMSAEVLQNESLLPFGGGSRAHNTDAESDVFAVGLKFQESRQQHFQGNKGIDGNCTLLRGFIPVQSTHDR